jgi:predicted CXXCH cytochrome family protein
VEHKGRALLVEAADQHCTQCHRDLKTKDGASRFHKTIPSLREHPEFAVDVREPGTQPPAPGATLLRVRLDDKAKLADNTPIKLNHARHVKANLKGIADVQKQLGSTGIVKVKDGLQLGCTFCHRPDGTWQYMQPVTYKQHCAICHELSTGIGDLVAPHDKPGLVRAFIRGAAGDAFDACQSIPKGDTGKALRDKCEGFGLAAAAPAPAEDQPRGRRRGGDEAPTPAPDEPRPGRRRTSALGTDIILVQDTPRGLRRRGEATEEAPPADTPRGGRRRGGDEEATPAPSTGGGGGGASWVLQQLSGGEKKLFGTKEDGCEKCHVLNRVAGSPVPEVLTPAMPARWLPHSKFDHAPHRPVACGECHKAAASSETKDVLLPAIGSCRGCHQPRGGGARSGCVECHRYHDKGKERDADGPYKVDQLLSGVGRKR